MIPISSDRLQQLKRKLIDTCSLCGGVGVRSTLKENAIVLDDCKCLLHFRHAVACEHANIPPRYRGFTFDKLTDEFLSKNEAAVDLVKDFAQHLERNLASGRGLFFQASQGLAKSSLVGLLLERALRAHHVVFYARMSKLLKWKFESIRGKEEARRLIQRLLEDVELLALEEIEKVALTGPAQDIPETLVRELLDEVLSDIYDAGTSLLLTANVIREDMTHFSPAIQDRLRELTEVVFVGKSHRRTHV